MELKRASLIQTTPSATPRNSMLIAPPQQLTTGSHSSQMFDLQEFLAKFEPEDSPGMPVEAESQQQLKSRLRSSQQSVSQVSNRSKSSSSLHSAPSSTSMSRENLEREHNAPVIANPGALGANLNNNNNNNSNNSNDSSQESAPFVAATNYNMTTGSATLVEGGERSAGDGGGPNSSTPNYPKAINVAEGQEMPSVLSWGDASSIGSRSLSSSSTGDIRLSQGTGGSQHLVVPTSDVNYVQQKQRSYSTSAGSNETNSDFPKSISSDRLKKSGKTKSSKGRSLFRRHFHRSSDDLLEEPAVPRSVGKPPLVQRKFHKSAVELVDPKRKPGGKKRVDFSKVEGVSNAASLSGLTDLRHRGEMANVQLPKKTKNIKRRSLQPRSVVPSRSQECLQEEREMSNGSADELMTLNDFLSELNPPSLSQPLPHNIPPSSPRSPGQDSIWQEYGCV